MTNDDHYAPETERATAWRSLPSVPAANLRMVEKAFTSDADAVLLDLEDAVAPDAKAEARRNVTRILKELSRGEPRAPTGLRKKRGSRA